MSKLVLILNRNVVVGHSSDRCICNEGKAEEEDAEGDDSR